MTSPAAPVRSPERAPGDAGAPRVGPVSVVVCNYNGVGYLDECLASVRGLRGAVSEIVVVDNASDDGSVAHLRAHHPDVRIVELAHNRGPSVARNAGMRAARERWVLAIDNDAVLPPECLESLARALEDDPGALIAQPRSVFDAEPTRVHYDGGWFHYAGLLSLRNFYRPLATAEGHGVVAVDGAIAIALLLDRDEVLEIGGYDEDFFILFEDYDLSLRVRIAGWRVLSVEDVHVRHKGGTPGISFREGEYPRFRAYYHSLNRWLVLVKNHGLGTLLVSAPGVLLYELVWLAFALRSGFLRAHVAGKLAFLRMLPETLRKRRAIQARRRTRDRDLLVGGPLTFSPLLLRARPAALAARSLDAALSTWWRLVRILVP